MNLATGEITTVAGNGSTLDTGDNGPATSAGLDYPYGVAVDAQGNLFISDDGGEVREVHAATGIITLYAGQFNNDGYSGDNGPAVSAQLNTLGGVALDAQGDLYIVDQGNNVIRRVTAVASSLTGVAPSGGFVQGGGTTKITWSSTNVGNVDILLSTNNGQTFSTIIASNAPNFDLYAWSVPADLNTTQAKIEVVDHADPGVSAASATAFRVLKPTAPIISTVAGMFGGGGYTGDGGPAVSALLMSPQGMAEDAAGDLFIADSNNNVVREIHAGTGVITTVAGIFGEQGTAGDGGPATSAELITPEGVAVDGQGNLFIADTGNSAIREVNAVTGVITTIAGQLGQEGDSGDGGRATSALLNLPGDVVLDGKGDLFIADSDNDAVREVNLTTGTITTVAGTLGQPGSSGDGGPATSALLNFPTGIALDGAGNLFIADSGNNAVREVNLSTGTITTVAGTLGVSGSSGDGGPATGAKLNFPAAVAVDSQGDLFIADANNNAVREVKGGTISTYAGTIGQQGASGDNGQATSAKLYGPFGLVLDGEGILFVADQFNNVVRRVTPAAAISNVQPSAVTVQGGGATKITWSSASVGNVDILLSLDGGNTFTPIASNVPNSGVYGWSVPADLSTTMAEIRVVDHNNNTVAGASAATFTISMPTAPIISTVAGSSTGAAGYGGDGGQAVAALLNAPTGVAFDSQGNWFIADGNNNVVREVHAGTGVITTVAGNGTQGFGGDGGPATLAELSGPAAVAVDGQGNLFITDQLNNRIREVNLSTGIITTVAGNGQSGSSGDGGQATSAKLSFPDGMALDSQGDLFFADSGTNRIREVNLSTGVITTVAGTGAFGSTGDGGQATSARLFGAMAWRWTARAISSSPTPPTTASAR